jgi:molybdopterin synthase catalytic subunit
MTVFVQNKDFKAGETINRLSKENTTGAVVSFVGFVRSFYDVQSDAKDMKLEIEHYPKMTLKSLEQIEQEARLRWSINNVEIIHRFGELKMNDQIVLVAVSSSHRKEAFLACEFIIDYLKTEAPFWKKEITDSKEEKWVEIKEADINKKNNWF